MFEWWESLGEVGRVFACVAIPSTVILFLQTILMLIGIGLTRFFRSKEVEM